MLLHITVKNLKYMKSLLIVFLSLFISFTTISCDAQGLANFGKQEKQKDLAHYIKWTLTFEL